MDIIQEILGFKDLHLDSISEEKSKGKYCRVLHLTYCGEIPTICPVCGEKLYKHGKRKLVVDDTPPYWLPCKARDHDPQKALH